MSARPGDGETGGGEAGPHRASALPAFATAGSSAGGTAPLPSRAPEGTDPRPGRGRYFLGVDGGGTRTTIALADGDGTELIRREGSPGIVDPRWPLAAAESVVRLARAVMQGVGVAPPVEALCAGLAGSGDPAARRAVRGALESAQLARRVIVCSDGEIALEGAFLGGPGLLLVAGTGSVAWARSIDGRVERCGGWGALAGDEGSAYWLGCAALRAALRAHDGRGMDTVLLSRVLHATGVDTPDAVPGWAGRASKDRIAALAQEVVRAAGEGDAVAAGLVAEAAAGLVEHAAALARRIGRRDGAVPVVLHGGLATHPPFAREVARLMDDGPQMRITTARADAVTGALRIARRR